MNHRWLYSGKGTIVKGKVTGTAYSRISYARTWGQNSVIEGKLSRSINNINIVAFESLRHDSLPCSRVFKSKAQISLDIAQSRSSLEVHVCCLLQFESVRYVLTLFRVVVVVAYHCWQVNQKCQRHRGHWATTGEGTLQFTLVIRNSWITEEQRRLFISNTMGITLAGRDHAERDGSMGSPQYISVGLSW